MRALVLGVLNILAGIILASFVIMMQNFFAFILGVLYIVFGTALIFNKILGKLLKWVIIPLTVLHSVFVMMLGISRDVPSYYNTPLIIGIPILILPLWCLVFGNIYHSKHAGEKKEK